MNVISYELYLLSKCCMSKSMILEGEEIQNTTTMAELLFSISQASCRVQGKFTNLVDN